jgi:archaellum component FlaC
MRKFSKLLQALLKFTRDFEEAKNDFDKGSDALGKATEEIEKLYSMDNILNDRYCDLNNKLNELMINKEENQDEILQTLAVLSELRILIEISNRY